MLTVNHDLCIGCGLCVKDCFPHSIGLVNGKAQTVKLPCIECAHCISICPTNAIRFTGPEYAQEDTPACTLADAKMDPDMLLKAIRARRSIRYYKRNKPVEQEKIDMIIAAGKYTPTAANLQPVSYVIVRDKIPELCNLVLDALCDAAKEYLADPNTEERMVNYANRWLRMAEEHRADPEKNDDVTFFAPLLIILYAAPDKYTRLDCGLVASSMERMIYAQGLGSLFSGYVVRAASQSKKVRDFLGIPEDKEVASCLIVGYPDIDYKRAAPRKKVEIKYM
jgi:nitroreductase/NAD-dependent dihydropyrimidine dehydrogenase PreA subunit